MSFDGYSVIFEDEHLAIIDKKANLLCHHSKYAGNINEKSLAQLLKEHFQRDIHLINRLDRKTSGLLMVGFKPSIVQLMQQKIQSNSLSKKYLALVRGWTDAQLTIHSPIKNDEKGRYQKALTHLKLLDKCEYEKAVTPYPTARYSLIELQPITGRTHQLRKHMNKIAHPIIGDPKHGNRHHNHAFQDWFNCHHLFLHAHQLSFEHPVTNEKCTFTATLPVNWYPVLSAIGIKNPFDNNQKLKD